MILQAEMPRTAISYEEESSSIALGEEKSINSVRTEIRPTQVQYTFKQKYFSPDDGRTTIRLYAYPTITVDMNDFSCELEGWEIKIPSSEIIRLPREISRKFVTLWGKAQRKSLSEHESLVWLNILDLVDYREFSIDRAEARTMEGLLLRNSPFWYVEWSDGERARVPENIAGALRIVEPGELFTAKVRLGNEDKTEAIFNVVPLGPKEEVLAEIFSEWQSGKNSQ